MSEQQKDYSLLRPFDLEAAKRGDAICWKDGALLQDVTITKLGSVCGRWDDSTTERMWSVDRLYNFRMAPLCWVEGKPVYEGDVLYNKARGNRRVVDYVQEYGAVKVAIFCEDGRWNHADGLTWTPPRVKREVKVLAWLTRESLVWKLEGAPVQEYYVRVPSEDKVIEIEQPAEQGNGK